MKFLLQYDIIVVQIGRVSMMLQILLNHFICYISSTPYTIPNCPKMSAPISFSKFRKFFLEPPGCSSFQSLNKITNALGRSIFNMDVNMVFTNYPFKDTNILTVTNLFYQFPTPNLQIAFKNLKTILCNPDNMRCQPRYCVPPTPLSFFHRSKLRKWVATESLALKCIVSTNDCDQ